MSDERFGNQSAERRSGGRLVMTVLLIVALVVSGLTRELGRHVRAVPLPHSQAFAVSGTSLSSMNSFALALLLGGLRGPLVMILWTNSENQKNERNLEDFDTLVEWIRLLQPEFDSVHLFQIWNKAYNISVQMASLANKYATIVDALDYAYKVDAERPNNINIISQIGQVYEQKLGTSSEKDYYRKRVRNETLPVIRLYYPASADEALTEAIKKARVSQNLVRRSNDPQTGQMVAQMSFLDHLAIRSFFNVPEARSEAIASQALRSRQTSRRTSLDTVLTEDGRLLPEYRDRYSYLVPFEPFREGISPIGLGYEYYKRAQLLQREGQQHSQMSEMVVDSRPALALKMWAEELMERGRLAEYRALGGTGAIPTMVEPAALQLPTAGVPLNASVHESWALESAIFNYDRVPLLVQASVAEYQEHLLKYRTNEFIYRGHMEHLRAIATLAQGDRDFLRALRAEPSERPNLLASSARFYRDAIEQNQLIILRHYVADEILAAALPRGYSLEDAKGIGPRQMPAQLYGPVLDRAREITQDLFRRGALAYDQHEEDRQEYEHYIERAQIRLRTIQTAGAQAAR